MVFEEITEQPSTIESIFDRHHPTPADAIYSVPSPFYIYRGQESQELLDIFLSRTNIGKMAIKIIQTDGEEESGVDTGGVLRDSLTAFWTYFYEMETEGTKFKVVFYFIIYT